MLTNNKEWSCARVHDLVGSGKREVAEAVPRSPSSCERMSRGTTGSHPKKGQCLYFCKTDACDSPLLFLCFLSRESRQFYSMPTFVYSVFVQPIDRQKGLEGPTRPKKTKSRKAKRERRRDKGPPRQRPKLKE
jgi:hypothetical protein